MAKFEIFLPIKGVSEFMPVDKQPNLTSGDMDNVRPRDVMDNRLRLGQRPALANLYTTALSTNSRPVVELLSITYVG
jgi:hypothetical protein